MRAALSSILYANDWRPPATSALEKFAKVTTTTTSVEAVIASTAAGDKLKNTIKEAMPRLVRVLGQR